MDERNDDASASDRRDTATDEMTMTDEMTTTEATTDATSDATTTEVTSDGRDEEEAYYKQTGELGADTAEQYERRSALRRARIATREAELQDLRNLPVGKVSEWLEKRSSAAAKRVQRAWRGGGGSGGGGDVGGDGDEGQSLARDAASKRKARLQMAREVGEIANERIRVAKAAAHARKVWQDGGFDEGEQEQAQRAKFFIAPPPPDPSAAKLDDLRHEMAMRYRKRVKEEAEEEREEEAKDSRRGRSIHSAAQQRYQRLLEVRMRATHLLSMWQGRQETGIDEAARKERAMILQESRNLRKALCRPSSLASVSAAPDEMAVGDASPRTIRERRLKNNAGDAINLPKGMRLIRARKMHEQMISAVGSEEKWWRVVRDGQDGDIRVKGAGYDHQWPIGSAVEGISEALNDESKELSEWWLSFALGAISESQMAKSAVQTVTESNTRAVNNVDFMSEVERETRRLLMQHRRKLAKETLERSVAKDKQRMLEASMRSLPGEKLDALGNGIEDLEGHSESEEDYGSSFAGRSQSMRRSKSPASLALQSQLDATLAMLEAPMSPSLKARQNADADSVEEGKRSSHEGTFQEVHGDDRRDRRAHAGVGKKLGGKGYKRQSFMAQETLERSFRDLNEAGILDTSPRPHVQRSPLSSPHSPREGGSRRGFHRANSNPERSPSQLEAHRPPLRRAASSGAEEATFGATPVEVDSRAMTMPSSKLSSRRASGGTSHRRSRTTDATPRKRTDLVDVLVRLFQRHAQELGREGSDAYADIVGRLHAFRSYSKDEDTIEAEDFLTFLIDLDGEVSDQRTLQSLPDNDLAHMVTIIDPDFGRNDSGDTLLRCDLIMSWWGAHV
eukprot:g392.t1